MNLEPLPPCQAACPVHTDARDYLRLIAEGRYREAFAVIARSNPFPSVCAHICQRPCEKECRRSQVDAPVGIRALKRFVVDRPGAERPPPAPHPEVRPAERCASVAVVGAGPAGLTAAYDLRLAGHKVHVFERLDRPGGMLNVIPRYRLPRSALEADLEAIRATGIRITCRSEVGRHDSIAGLIERGFEAVVVATGLSRSRGIAVPGFGAQRFTAAIPWMTDVWLGNKVDLGRQVAVIGGGNVAVDVARTARRLGAPSVTMICLESRDEMPAEPEEVRLAEAEGVRLLPRRALKRVLNRSGRIVALELMRVVSVFDAEGRFRPTYAPSSIRTLNADMVILSIGQAPDRSWARGSAVRLDERGRAVVDRQTGAASLPRVFLAGECLRGPGSAVQAVAEGHRVAAVVAAFLQSGRVHPPPPGRCRPLEPLPEATRLRQLERVVGEPGPFAPSEPPVEEADALREAGRCLGCLAGAVIDENRCAACLTCARVCPLDAIDVADPMRADPVRCQACGLCAALCPAAAIELSYWTFPAGEAVDGAARPARGEAVALLYCRHAGRRPEAAGSAVGVPCLGRLKPVDLLRLLARGCRGVVLEPCAAEECKYGSAWRNVRTVVEFTRGILAGAGLEARIELREPAGSATPGPPARPHGESP